MDAFHRRATAGDVIEGLIQLGQVSGLDHQMEVAELFGRQAQLAAAELQPSIRPRSFRWPI